MTKQSEDREETDGMDLSMGEGNNSDQEFASIMEEAAENNALFIGDDEVFGFHEALGDPTGSAEVVAVVVHATEYTGDQ